MACEFKCQEHVRFLGHQRETGILYGAADLFVLPSVFDPIANVVLESLYTGTPVITGPQVGASELIRNGINGLVVGDYGPETLTEAIMKFYRSDEKEKMAAEAHRAAAAYRWDRHISRLEALFLRTLAQKNSAHKSTCL